MKVRLALFGLIVMQTLMAAEIYDFKLKDLNQQNKTFFELKGEKLTLLDFWATWCKPCVRAIPKLNALAEKYREKGVNFVGINIDTPRNVSKVKPFSESKGISYTILLDTNNELMTELHVTLVPTLLFVNDKNEIVHIHQGFLPGDEKEIEKMIETFLNESEDQ
jgi:cytochrome c biogenesis protein CcmG/thiol:disulfide interchange protein DsbE